MIARLHVVSILALIIFVTLIPDMRPVNFLTHDADDKQIAQALMWCYDVLKEYAQTPFSREKLFHIANELLPYLSIDKTRRLSLIHYLRACYTHESEITTLVVHELSEEAQEAIKSTINIQKTVNKLLADYELLKDSFDLIAQIEQIEIEPPTTSPLSELKNLKLEAPTPTSPFSTPPSSPKKVRPTASPSTIRNHT